MKTNNANRLLFILSFLTLGCGHILIASVLCISCKHTPDTRSQKKIESTMAIGTLFISNSKLNKLVNVYMQIIAKRQILSQPDYIQTDTLFISISELNRQVDAYTQIIKERKKLSQPDYIQIVRIINTLSYYSDLLHQKNFELFYKNVNANITEDAVRVLEASITKGMCYYSQKHNLYIGGSPHLNSQYFIK